MVSTLSTFFLFKFTNFLNDSSCHNESGFYKVWAGLINIYNFENSAYFGGGFL